jgi:hypothetical protein
MGRVSTRGWREASHDYPSLPHLTIHSASAVLDHEVLLCPALGFGCRALKEGGREGGREGGKEGRKEGGGEVDGEGRR